jgi:hypothetical protein
MWILIIVLSKNSWEGASVVPAPWLGHVSGRFKRTQFGVVRTQIGHRPKSNSISTVLKLHLHLQQNKVFYDTN